MHLQFPLREIIQKFYLSQNGNFVKLIKALKVQFTTRKITLFENQEKFQLLQKYKILTQIWESKQMPFNFSIHDN